MLRRLTLVSTVTKDNKFLSYNSSLLLVLFLCLPVSGYAASPGAAQSTTESSPAKEVESTDLFIRMAKLQNDPAAQYYLGRRYLSGINVSKNAEQAAKWFLLSAKQGHLKARYELAILYKFGRGVKQDDKAAFRSFLTAAEKGHAGAMYELANYYFFGLNGKNNVNKALRWYREAANLYHGEAQYQLGKILKEGLGTKANRKEGKKWLRKAQESGVGGSVVKKDKKKKKKAKRKKSKTSDVTSLAAIIKKEGVDMQFSIGMRYLNGIGKPRQPKIAIQWLREAAQNDHAGAQLELGKMYLKGIGVSKSNGEAIKWLSKAASWGLPGAKSTLEDLKDQQLVSYIKGSRAGPNIKKPEEQFKVGQLYLEGKLLKKNILRAADWIIKAARNKHPQAQYQTGVMYRDGIGFVKDRVKAEYWFEKAAASGIPEARKALMAFKLPTQNRNVRSASAKKEQNVKNVSLTKKYRNPAKQYQAGMMLLSKKEIKNHAHDSIMLLTDSANQGYIDAQKQLAKMYSRGDVIERDLTVAAAWQQKAAEAGDADSQFALGNIYKKGLGVDKSNSLAVKWYRVAARQGHRNARSILGCRIC